jgi:hypothetical protein
VVFFFDFDFKRLIFRSLVVGASNVWASPKLSYAIDRGTIRQKKPGRLVRFELTDQTRLAVDEYLRLAGAGAECKGHGFDLAREGEQPPCPHSLRPSL